MIGDGKRPFWRRRTVAIRNATFVASAGLRLDSNREVSRLELIRPFVHGGMAAFLAPPLKWLPLSGAPWNLLPYDTLPPRFSVPCFAGAKAEKRHRNF